MDKDVYTSPPTNTFMLGTIFSLSQNGKSITSIAVSTASLPLLLALYTIIIQLAFTALWQLLAAVLLVTLNVNDRIQIVGIVAFWNSADPVAATFRSVSYVKMLLARPGGSKYLRTAIVMALLAVITAGASIGVGIKYADWIQLDSVAPAHPSSVFWPYFGEVTDETMVRIYSQARPGILRALGSAEAVESNSQLSRVSIKPIERPDSTVDQPQEQLDYEYALTAQDFGLQGLPDLVLSVKGSCRTDYSWAHRKKSPSGYTYDYYFPWGNTSNQDKVFIAATELDPIPLLAFVAWLHPDIDSPAQARNRSFAFLAATALTPSTTASSDPWYKTEPSNNTQTALGLQYVVQSNRPVLDCWEATEICTGGACYSSLLDGSPVPQGTAEIFRTRFAHPMMAHIAMSTGVSSIKSYVGSAGGAYIDAGNSNLFSDMTRLVLAGYLSSAQVFQEVVLSPRSSPDARSILESSPGQLLDGAASFVVKTDGAIALRLDLVLLAPILCAVLWAAVGTLKLIRAEAGRSRLGIRSAALSATQLYRQLDEKSTGEIWDEHKNKSTIPRPPEQLENWNIEAMNEKGKGPCVRFTENINRLTQISNTPNYPPRASTPNGQAEHHQAPQPIAT